MRTSIALVLAACGHDPSPPPDTPPPVTGCTTLGPFEHVGTAALPGIASDPSVLRDGGTLKMWFTTANPMPPANLRTAYAESADGVAWSKVDDAVIEPTAGTFDGNGIETVSVVRAGAQYVAYYTGDEPPEGSNRFAIGRAVSADGIAWTKDAGVAFAPELPWELPFCADDACTSMVGGTERRSCW